MSAYSTNWNPRQSNAYNTFPTQNCPHPDWRTAVTKSGKNQGRTYKKCTTCNYYEYLPDYLGAPTPDGNLMQTEENKVTQFPPRSAPQNIKNDVSKSTQELLEEINGEISEISETFKQISKYLSFIPVYVQSLNNKNE